jgi:uncharacterized phage-like protein YoqJ
VTFVVAATGHRPDKLYPEVWGAPYAPPLDEVLRDLARPALEGIADVVISGVAQGWDLAVAEVAIDLGIPLVCAVPFREQAEMWLPYDRSRYAATLARAWRVVEVCEPGFAAWKYHKRNEWMVDRCNALLALHNGDADGGTAACLRYAEKHSRPLVNAWAQFYAEYDHALPF